MKTSHAGLDISHSDWEVLMRHVVATLEQFNAPEPEKREVPAFVTSLKGDREDVRTRRPALTPARPGQ